MATEKRLIDANAIPGGWLLAKFVHCNGRRCLTETKLLRDIPTVDAVEVVRCKDCKHYVLHALACRNEHMNGFIAMDGFCSYGERKDDGKNQN